MGEGSQSIGVFIFLVVFIGLWGAQAVAAHRRAVALGGRPGGAIQLLALAPAVILAITGFWLVGGTSGSPAATFQRYVSAWQEDLPDRAADLFVAQPDRAVLAASFRADSLALRGRLQGLRDALGPESGIDPANPFSSLAFEYAAGEAPRRGGAAAIEVHIIRRVSVPTTLFGLFPAATQQSVPVASFAHATLREVPAQALPGLGSLDRVWRIESFRVEETSQAIP